MKHQPNRLATAEPHQLQGSAIDRARPLQFRLDGRIVHGFAGDTVLSALLSCGIDMAGPRNGASLALSARQAPAISFAPLVGEPPQALPMERTLATEGADYLTIAGKAVGSPFARLLRRRARSLDIDLDRPEALLRPWLGSSAGSGPQADLVVVGGGVAGLTAAMAAAKRGLRVVLAEASPQLGGKARLFGTQEGEETPDAAIARLRALVAASEAITVLTSAEVFALRPGRIRLHQVGIHDGKPAGQVLDLAARYIVLATGALERLPVFPGNRLPGVSGALEAFEMAQLYGVWPGASTLVATSSSPAYRLAMLARDAGIAVQRILDARTDPQSRFIEFAKAYGITMASGTIVASAAPAPRGKGLLVTPQLAMVGYSRAEPTEAVDRLVVCGGWQPDLTLWHMAGGESAWSAASARLEPRNGPTGIALAGSAAGWMGRTACVDSAIDAVDLLLDRQRKPVQERSIDPIYESADAPAPIGALPEEAAEPAYLDGGWRHLERPRAAASRRPGWWPFGSATPGWSLAATPQPLDIGAIAAGVQLGAIPAASAGVVAQERVAMVALDSPGNLAPQPDSRPLPLPPSYLGGRYENAALWLVAPDDARLLDVGALIYADADVTDPLQAIGVVVRVIDGKTVALVTGHEGQCASIRDTGRAIAIRLVAPYRGGMTTAS